MRNNPVIYCLLALLVLGMHSEVEAGATTAWSKDFSKEKPRKIRDGLEVVEDKAAEGGLALKINHTGGVIHGCVEGKKIRAAGLVTVAVRFRGNGFKADSIATQLTFSANFQRSQPCRLIDGDLPVQNHRVNAAGYGECTARIQLDDEPTEYDFTLASYWNPDPNLPKGEVWIDRVEVRANDDAAPCISRVETDKVAYRPGQTVHATVTVLNPSKDPFEGKLLVKELCGLDGTITVAQPTVAVAPGGVSRAQVEWSAALPEAGRELQVELLDAKKQVLHTAVDYYGIAKDPSFLSTISAGVGASGRPKYNGLNYASTANRIQLKGATEATKAAHVQRVEIFSWSYCELAQFIPPPEEEPYLGNEGIWWKGFRMVKEQVRMLKDIGTTPISYVNGGFWGPAAYQLYQQRPEWFTVGSFDMQSRVKYGRRHEMEFAQDHYPFFYCYINPLLPETRQYVADQFIRLAKEMGFEGVRWDVWNMNVEKGYADMFGKELVHTDEDADRLSAESIAAVKALVNKEIPDFTWGYNYGAPEENTRTPLTLAEKCRGGGWVLDEVICTYQSKTSPFHYWEAYRDRIVGWGDKIRQMGGIYDPFPFNRDYSATHPVDHLYQAIFRLIAGSRSYGPASFGQWGVMAFRYSDVFFGWNLRLQPEKQTLVAVTAPETLWWKTMVLANKTSNGRLQAIVHLVNSPTVKEVEENKDGTIRAPVENVKVRCGEQGGRKPSKAWLVTAEPLTTADEAKVQAVPLKMGSEKDGASVTVPYVRAWKTVVFEY